MIDLYTWATPNGKKISIALEELALPYRVHKIDISRGDQHTPEFTRLNPNQKIPVIVDSDTGLTLMESGAILLYLANKTGKLIPGDSEAYWGVIQWLMWQKAGFGPMLGQANHFIKFNPGKSEYSEERYGKETARLYGVLDRQLADGGYIVGSEYSIADIAAWPWTARHGFHGIDLNQFPNVLAWYLKVAARPAVKAGWAVPIPQEVPLPPGEDDD